MKGGLITADNGGLITVEQLEGEEESSEELDDWEDKGVTEDSGAAAADTNRRPQTALVHYGIAQWRGG